jgi:hypothetical protein
MPFRFDALTYRKGNEESICSTATQRGNAINKLLCILSAQSTFG